jgi:hypothetical protein
MFRGGDPEVAFGDVKQGGGSVGLGPAASAGGDREQGERPQHKGGREEAPWPQRHLDCFDRYEVVGSDPNGGGSVRLGRPRCFVHHRPPRANPGRRLALWQTSWQRSGSGWGSGRSLKRFPRPIGVRWSELALHRSFRPEPATHQRVMCARGEELQGVRNSAGPVPSSECATSPGRPSARSDRRERRCQGPRPRLPGSRGQPGAIRAGRR